MTYIESILSTKYDVVIDPVNPDLVFWTNLGFSATQEDRYTGSYGSSHDHFPQAKKIFLSCEAISDHSSVLNLGEKYFAIGPQPLVHERYLHMALHNTIAAWGLYDESKLYDTPYDWLIENSKFSKIDEILNNKKHFCGVVQNSVYPYRVEIFNALNNYKFVRASGGWITNVPREEAAAQHASIDGIGYKHKINFLSNCKFSIQVQSNAVRHLTVEKMIHAYAANTIPIYYGNDLVLEDGFNPRSFINCHDYASVDEVVQKVKEIDNSPELYKQMLLEPIFNENKLPSYFDTDYIFSFLDKVIQQ